MLKDEVSIAVAMSISEALAAPIMPFDVPEVKASTAKSLSILSKIIGFKTTIMVSVVIWAISSIELDFDSCAEITSETKTSKSFEVVKFIPDSSIIKLIPAAPWLCIRAFCFESNSIAYAG